MRDITFAEQEILVASLIEMVKRRADKEHRRGTWEWGPPVISNDDIGRAIPREWYNLTDDFCINKASKAMIRGRVRMAFGDYKRHGGNRKGAGRKKGRTVASNTITMSNEAWAKLDAIRGNLSRGRFLESRIQVLKAISRRKTES